MQFPDSFRAKQETAGYLSLGPKGTVKGERRNEFW